MQKKIFLELFYVLFLCFSDAFHAFFSTCNMQCPVKYSGNTFYHTIESQDNPLNKLPCMVVHRSMCRFTIQCVEEALGSVLKQLAKPDDERLNSLRLQNVNDLRNQSVDDHDVIKSQIHVEASNFVCTFDYIKVGTVFD